MAYYIAKFRGFSLNKEEVLPQHIDPEGSEWSMINIMPDPGKVGGGGLNAILLWTEENIPQLDPNYMKIAEDKKEFLTTQNIRNIESRLNLAVNHLETQRLDNVIMNLLFNPPANGWKPVVPKRSTRTLPIHLGPWNLDSKGNRLNRKLMEVGIPDPVLKKMAPELFGYMMMAFAFLFSPVMAVVTEDFDGGDNSTPGIDHSWTERSGSALENLSNECNTQSGGTQGYAVCDDGVSSSNHYCQVDLEALTLSAGFDAIGPVTRMTTSGNLDCFYYRAKGFSGSNGHNLERIVNLGFVSGANDSLTPSPPGEIHRLESDGSDHQGFVDGDATGAASLTQSGGSGETNGGIFGIAQTGQVATCDDWELGDLGGETVVKASRKNVLRPRIWR